MALYQQYQCIISMVLVPRLVKNKQWPRMRLLLKSTGPCTPGGRKLQPVPYPIHWSHIAINIEQPLIPLESQVSNVVEYHFFMEHIFLSHENIKSIESNVLFYRTYLSSYETNENIEPDVVSSIGSIGSNYATLQNL